MKVFFIILCGLALAFVGGCGVNMGMELESLLIITVIVNIVFIVLALVDSRNSGRALVAVGIGYFMFIYFDFIHIIPQGVTWIVTPLVFVKSSFAVGIGLSIAAKE